MSAESALAVLAVLERAGIDVVVDGGWGIDALLGVERRTHGDLDLIVPLARVPDAVSAVSHLGFVPVADTLPVTLVLAAPGGRRVDLHPTVVNEHGDQVQAQPFGRSFAYPASALGGSGSIGTASVRCLTAEGQVLTHLGYPPDGDDRDDMQALVVAFGVGLGVWFADGEDVEVRDATLADLAPMADVQLRSSVAAYRWPGNEAWADSADHGMFWRVWESRLGAPRTWSGVATIGGAIVGTVHVRPWAGDDLDPASAAELNGAYVDPRAQGRGLGRLLSDAAIAAAACLGYDDLRLHVIEHNDRGQRFWEHLGWVRDGVDREVSGAGGMLEHRYISPGHISRRGREVRR
jgi:lincosamide nucleotidyltransferase A/C/D/E